MLATSALDTRRDIKKYEEFNWYFSLSTSPTKTM